MTRSTYSGMPSAFTLWPRNLRPKSLSSPRPQPAAKVNLEAGHLLARLVVEHQLALESDVGDLHASARVRAAVDVHSDGVVDVREHLVQLLDHLPRGGLGLDDRELAVFDAGARDRVAAELAGLGVELEGAEPIDDVADLVLGNVEHEDLLERRQPNAVRAGGSARRRSP